LIALDNKQTMLISSFLSGLVIHLDDSKITCG
jgi:hypothetical protein